MTRQEKFKELLGKHGYKSLNAFCVENGLDQGNFNRRLKYQDLAVDVKTMFKLANALHEPIEAIVAIFYPTEWEENQKLIEK